MVVFRAADGRLLAHRLLGYRLHAGRLALVTRGDANTATEHWNVPVDGSVGKVVYTVPKIGYALVWTGTVPARIALIVIPALLLCWTGLTRIWRSSPEPEASAGE